QEAMLKWLGPPVSFAPQRPEHCLDLGEWWLWRSCVAAPGATTREPVGESFPNLAQGFVAAKARESNDFTEYDGYVPEAGQDHDSKEQIFSPTQLETLARCPQEYFFKHILKIYPPEIYQYEPNRWLDPLDKGSLLHAVYCEFMAELLKENKLPEYQRDWQALNKILERHLAREAARTPPPNPEVFRRECKELRRTATVFLREEEDFCKESTPTCLEASIGMPSQGEGGFLDSETPVEIKLPGGTSIRVKGRIDRLDCKPESKGMNFAIWDYKSGSSRKFEINPPFNEGRVVQNALYFAMVQARLREAAKTGAMVDSFGYVFHSVREGGKRLTWNAAELAGGMEVVKNLCDLLAAGCFPASNTQDDLRSYDYPELFSDAQTLARQMQAKLDNPGNPALEPLRKLRGLAVEGEADAK
ncbi:MAG: PD-(D/E)XK nuclease family protein, partial [Planctomycetes bacterium]|nr:PD-(D/E)XK nuclease family protein [Planctomycetota bacterium]